MANYRLYRLDGTGRISLADWVEADTDEQAIEKARQIDHGALKCEVWRRKRLVKTLTVEELT